MRELDELSIELLRQIIIYNAHLFLIFINRVYSNI